MTKGRKIIKVVIIGEKSVGKTSILRRYVDKRFVTLKPTIGVDFVMVSENMVTLQLWDTSGQERFRSLEISYYRGADYCILVFDVTNEKTLYDLKLWRDDFIEKTEIRDPILFPFIILGNKIDDPNRVVTEKAAIQWCKDNIGGNLTYFDTSAKDNINIEQVFKHISNQCENQPQSNEIPPEQLISLTEKKSNQSSCC
ncbi:Rab GTPase [Dictyostelium discoideum AX4]|uniref:Ras-related protein Rab-7B n=1 Tax=Dictyostelium discoideum TaxID=44689 RepID=RAB7B_DICDI|nr:Rab GTPase [Dictyostelium discoideum AX4]Q54K69.1 RecName: Full=Ras-related protein Rab-7B [Dictyostelium discoideum]EAL63676.1 Rab GTPase [Dictyostelium discoideum AX4]|eukprot:XP_637186.1 Rab GTPase [Dictyostelium discoideum AX4]